MTDVQTPADEQENQEQEQENTEEQETAKVAEMFGFELLSDGVEEVEADTSLRRDLTRHINTVDALPMNNNPDAPKKKRIRLGVLKGEIINDPESKNNGRGRNELSEFTAFQAAAFKLGVGLRIGIEDIPNDPTRVQFILIKVPRKVMSDEQKKNMRRARLQGEIELHNETNNITMTAEQLTAAVDQAVALDTMKKTVRAEGKMNGKRMSNDEVTAEAEKRIKAAAKAVPAKAAAPKA